MTCALGPLNAMSLLFIFPRIYQADAKVYTVSCMRKASEKQERQKCVCRLEALSCHKFARCHWSYETKAAILQSSMCDPVLRQEFPCRHKVGQYL
jgi:hypothetical protein